MQVDALLGDETASGCEVTSGDQLRRLCADNQVIERASSNAEAFSIKPGWRRGYADIWPRGCASTVCPQVSATGVVRPLDVR